MVNCDLMNNNWLLSALANGYKKGVYTDKAVQGIIDEIQTKRLILSVDAFRKAGLNASKDDEKTASEFSTCFRQILAADQLLESFVGSGKKADFDQFTIVTRQLNKDINSWAVTTRVTKGKLNPAFIRALDRESVSNVMMGFFFVGAVANCFNKDVYSADQVKGVLEQEEGLIKQADDNLEALQGNLDGAEQKQVKYYRDCLAQMKILTGALKTFVATGADKDHDSFKAAWGKTQQMIGAFLDSSKEQ